MEEKSKEIMDEGRDMAEHAKEKVTELGDTAKEKLHLGHDEQEVQATSEEPEHVL